MKIQIVNFLSFVATISQASASIESIKNWRQLQECQGVGDRCSNGRPCCDNLTCTDKMCVDAPDPTPLPTTTSPTPNLTPSPTYVSEELSCMILYYNMCII